MCGIAGCYGDLDKSELLKMVHSIKHRGPDNQGHEIIENISLGHSRLSIIDLTEASNQPMWDVDRKACIVFNGEIYNFKELREELIQLGYDFQSAGDTEVVLNLYLHHREKMFDKLSGIFSFAIYDSETKELLLARDSYGVKPLYYFQNERGFYFSSELKSLLPLIAKENLKLNFEAIFRTILFLWSPGPFTLINDILKLEAGHYLVVKDHQVVKHQKYWQWPEYKPSKSSISDICDDLQSALSYSVKEQLVSDVPIGAFLSGGLDSSLIASLAKNAGIDNLQCFTISSLRGGNDNDGFVNDLPYAKQVADYLDYPLKIVESKPDLLNLLPKMIYHLDEPQGDVAPLNVALICEQSKKMGINVLLSGAGGDDLFTGYRRHHAAYYEKYWTKLPLILRRILKIGSQKLPKSNALSRRLAKAFSFADLSGDERLLSYFYWMDPKLVRDLFTPEVAEQLSENPNQFILNELAKRPESEKVERMLYLEKKYFLVDHNFNYTDKMSMAYGVEVRVPFLDKKVVNIASTTPVRLKLKKGHGKWILKKMAENHLPSSVIYRPKAGFGGPLRHWMRHDLRPLVEEILSEKNIIRRKIFNPVKIRELIDKNNNGAEDYSYPLFTILCMEIWCKIFMDGDLEGIS